MIAKPAIALLPLLAVTSPLLGQQRWSEDQAGHQMAVASASQAPSCREGTPVLTPDSIGPVSPGQSLADLEQTCPELYYAWDWGDEGIPEPAVAVRLGDAVAVAVLKDTISTSLIYRVRVVSEAARTEEGFGPGTRVTEIIDRWGEPEFGVAECVLYMWFPARPGLSWRLRLASEGDCVDLAEFERTGDVGELLRGARVQEAILYEPSA